MVEVDDGIPAADDFLAGGIQAWRIGYVISTAFLRTIETGRKKVPLAEL